ncbi:unnamed protein product, partial [marine sediment metagenome]
MSRLMQICLMFIFSDALLTTAWAQIIHDAEQYILQ